MADGSDGQIKIIINTSSSGTNAVTITHKFFKYIISTKRSSETTVCVFKNSKYIIGGNA